MKQTEIGLIPEDWEVKSLGEIGEPCMCKRILKEQTSPTGDIPFYKIGTFGGIPDAYISRELFEQYKEQYNYPKKGTLLLSAAGTIGRVVVFDGKDSYFQDSNIVWIDNDETKVTNGFLFYCYSRMQWKTEEGGIVSRLYNANLKSTSFIAPKSLAEQERIAKALSDVDALISTTEKLIQKKMNIKQGAMQNLLTGKIRLPGFGPQTKYPTYKQTELGPIPEDWEVNSLGEIFEFRPNNTFTRDCLNDSKGEYQNVHYGDVLIKYPSILDCSKESIPFINEGINVKFSKYGIMEGDIIIADTAEDETVGKVVEIFNLGEKKIVSGLHTFLCRKITDDFTPRWLGYFMNQSIFHNQLLPFITGTKVSAISRAAIQNVKVLIPSKEEQTAIANVLSSMDKEIETLNTKLEKYRNLKTAMMQQLLTGKIRL